jgi:hypothetical protein
MQKYEILDEISAEVQSRRTGLNPIEYIYMTDDVKEVVVTDSLEWVHSKQQKHYKGVTLHLSSRI